MTAAPSTARRCSRCGRDKSVRYRTADGQPQCRSCYTRDESRWETCDGCARHRPVNARTPDGSALCVTCYARDHQPAIRCQGCGCVGPVAARATGRNEHHQSLCRRCYQHPVRTCGGCGRRRRVAVRATATTPDLCPTCHQAPVETCSVCGVDDLCRRTAEGKPICFRCQLTRRLDQLLVGPDPAILAQLTPLRAAVLSVNNPRTALGWLDRSDGAAVLGRHARGELPLTHNSLDQASGNDPRRMSIEHLRRMLVAADALPNRDEILAASRPPPRRSPRS